MGEALVDVVDDGVLSRAAPGGSPANVALGLGRLGIDVVLHTSVADDEYGRLIVDHLATSGVTLTSSSTSAASTSTAVATLDADGAAAYVFDVTWDPAPLPTSSPVLFHTGSIATILDPGAALVRDAIAAAEHDGALVTFDPNIRPALIRDADLARKRILELVELCNVVKLSDEDAAWLFPDTGVDLVLDALLQAGPSLVAVTRGGHGSILATDDLRVECGPAPVDAVDTIGAGDTYMAALIARVLDDPSIFYHAGLPDQWVRETARFASDAAARTVGRRGADLPWAAELASVTPR